MKPIVQLCIIGGVTLFNLLKLTPTYGQIIPDTTLPNNSSVINENNITTITGGTEAGSNLFHSFEQFSIPTNSAAYFNNNPSTQNIFSRVTGSSISNIDGLIKANGTASFFLLNSNGIIFGPNASLNLGGSFLSTTANSVLFGDGSQFGKIGSSKPLLTLSVPIGLNFSNNSGNINIVGNGNNTVASNFQPIVSNNSLSLGLRVQPQRTLAIVGGDVSVQGGILSSEGGRIELGSVDSGIVSLIPNSYGWALRYEEANSFKDIQLSQRTLVDASGFESGSIQVQAKNLQLSNSSLLLIQNQGTSLGNPIVVNASESIVINDLGLPVGVASGIWSETLGLGKGGDIVVSTPKLTVQSSGQIFTSAYGNVNAGNITLTVPDSLHIIGLLPGREGNGVIVGSLAVGDGRSGDIKISVGKLNIINGGVLLTSNLTPIKSNNVTRGSGNINIDATNLVEVDGTTTDLSIPSAISTATFSSGQAGNVVINTRVLRVTNGGRIDSSTGSSGSAGSVIVNATDLIEVKGAVPGSLNLSLIISSANIVEPSLQRLLRIPAIPSGLSGDVVINTSKLVVSEGGLVSVKNDGTGDAGNLNVISDSIELKNQGGISAATVTGNGGNVFLQSQNLLSINSNISATSGNFGNGGNITIDTGTLVALNNSDITARAFEGNGGNIQITTQGLFSSSDSEIDASSRFGVDGVVQTQVLGFDVSNSLTPLKNNLVTPEQVLKGSCLTRRNAQQGSFIVTGSGGLPINPYSGTETWDEPENTTYQSSSPLNSSNQIEVTPKKWQPGDPIVEAQTLIVTADGRGLLRTKQQIELANSGSLICKTDQTSN